MKISVDIEKCRTCPLPIILSIGISKVAAQLTRVNNLDRITYDFKYKWSGSDIDVILQYFEGDIIGTRRPIKETVMRRFTECGFY